MKMKEMLYFGEQALRGAGIEEAALDAWYLLEFVTGIDRAAYFADMDRAVSKSQRSQYEVLIGKRCMRIPLQHLTGEQEFMGLTFQVNEHVLIPRQDTETLVEETLEGVRPGMRILDMCTGSGCILLSLLKHGNAKYGMECGEGGNSGADLWKKFRITGVGVDISADALSTARRNSGQLGIDAQFVESNLFENVEGTFDIIVSNPPYIRTEVIRTLEKEVRCYDPLLALDGKEDGLHFYREIVEKSPDYLKKGGKLLFEIGHDQAEDVSALMERRGFEEIQVKKDLAGLDRVVSGVYNV